MTNANAAATPVAVPDMASDAALDAVALGVALLAARLDRPQELTTIRRLVAEMAICWPGTLTENWWKWLVECGRSLDLDVRVAEVQPRELVPLLSVGTPIVALADDGQTLVELVRRGRHGCYARRLDQQSLEDVFRSPRQPMRVVIAHTGDHHAEHGSHAHPRPLPLLWQLLQPEWNDIITVGLISSVAGVLMLSVPVTAQQLVRAVTFATLYQPVVVLTLMLLGLLGFVAVLQALQTYVAELIQRRLFVRVAATVGRQLPRVTPETWKHIHAPEIVNRFLDIVIVQKVVAALLVDGIGILLTTVIGMSVMAFYHPFLLGYDLLLLSFLALVLLVMGRRGVQTAISESKAKYAVMAWLEDVARCPSIFQSFGGESLAAERTDVLCTQYLQKRRSHFRILLRQILAILFIQVIATTALLGLGGYLVLQEQLTLGQLVAAELIVAMIVASFAKLGKHVEGWYDLLAAVDKLAHLTGLPLQTNAGIVGISREGAARLEVRLRDTQNFLSLSEKTVIGARGVSIEPGQQVALCHWEPAALDSLRAALSGQRTRSPWIVTVDGVDLADLRADLLSAHIAVAAQREFIPGTLAENIHLHRWSVTDADVLAALVVTGLTEEFRQTQIAISDAMQPGGWPLTTSQSIRLVIARALAGRPRALWIDGLLDALGDDDVRNLVRELQRMTIPTTVVVITDQQRVAGLFEPIDPTGVNAPTA
ncbi:MAG TPA: ABC transporter transmembrane domain-containing protein [Planctomycetaceae bacterium]|nr:ABC transporter transmembrane domain-containing protein [Planctomycetaceae bacterium]